MQDRDAVEQILHRKYDTTDVTDVNDLLVSYHAFKIHYEKSQKPTAIKGESAYSDYINYYIGNDPSHWASKVPKYHKLIYENIYPVYICVFMKTGFP